MVSKGPLLLGQYQLTAFISTAYRPLKFPCQCSLSWKLGTEKHVSQKFVPLREDGIMKFNEELKLVTKIAQNVETGQYEKKKFIISINFKTDSSTDIRQIGHLTIDLGQWIENPKLGEQVQFPLDKDKEGKLFLSMTCRKLRDASPAGYEGNVYELLRKQDTKRQNSLERSKNSTSQSNSVNVYSTIEKLTQELQSANMKIQEQKKKIRTFQMNQEQFSLVQVDLKGKNNDLEAKLMDYQIKFEDIESKLEELEDTQSQLENLRWQNNQLKSELQTTRRILQLRESSQDESGIERESEKEKILKDQLENLELSCTGLLESLKEREQNRKLLQQKWLNSEEECRNYASLLEKKDIEALSLKETIDSLKQRYQQFETPAKTEPLPLVTNQIGIQHIQQDKINDFLTPKTRKVENQEELSKQSKKLLAEIQLKQQEINQLLNNTTNLEKYIFEGQQRQKKDAEEIAKLHMQVQKSKKQLLEHKHSVQSTHILKVKNEELESYIRGLENQNKELAEQNQSLIFQQYNQALKSPKTLKQTKQPHQSPTSPSFQQLNLQKSKVSQLKTVVANLQEENQQMANKAKEEQEENDKLRSQLFKAEGIIDHLKKQLNIKNLDLQELGLVRLELEKQKAISVNIDCHLISQKHLVQNLERKLLILNEQYEAVKKELEEMTLRRSQRKQRKERSKTRYQKQIKVLSDEVIRLHDELYKIRMEEEDKEQEQQKILKGSRQRDQKQKPAPVRRNAFNTDSPELQQALKKVKDLEQQNKKLHQLCRLVSRRQIFKQSLLSMPTSQSITSLISILSKKKSMSDNKLVHYSDIKSWIDEKLHVATANLQKVKTFSGLNPQQRRQLVKGIRLVEESLTQILQKPIQY